MKSHRDLPPTFHSILTHIKRAFYNSHCLMHSIAINTSPSLILDYYQWGFDMEEDVVVGLLCALTLNVPVFLSLSG